MIKLDSFHSHRIAFLSLLVCWTAIPIAPALSQVAFVFALIFFILWKINTPKLAAPLSKEILIPLFCYLGIVILSAFLSEFHKESFRGVWKIAQQLLLFWMTAEVFAVKDELHWFEKITLLLFMILVFDGFFQYAFHIDCLRLRKIHESFSGERISGPFKTYGLYAAYLLILVFYIWHLRPRGLEKGFWEFTYKGHRIWAAASLVVIFITRSRGAVLAFLLAVISFLILRRKFRILAGFVVLMGISFFFVPRTMVFHFDKYYKEQSMIERFYLWHRAWDVIEAKPITGIGINAYAVGHSKYDKEKNWRVQNYYAHNGYLQMAAELGIPGLIAFLVFLFNFFRASGKRAELLPACDGWKITTLLLGSLAILFFALSDTVLHNGQSILEFWFVLGIIWAYASVSQKRFSSQ